VQTSVRPGRWHLISFGFIKPSGDEDVAPETPQKLQTLTLLCARDCTEFCRAAKGSRLISGRFIFIAHPKDVV
jgi:hypothetical protein